jgi:hypothetical protein
VRKGVNPRIGAPFPLEPDLSTDISAALEAGRGWTARKRRRPRRDDAGGYQHRHRP